MLIEISMGFQVREGSGIGKNVGSETIRLASHLRLIASRARVGFEARH